MKFASFTRVACVPALLALFSTSALATCDQINPTGGTCPGTEACPDSDPNSDAVCVTGAPGPVQLQCTPHSTYVYCEAWPQSIPYGQFSYSWKTSGTASISYQTDPRDPFVYLNCSRTVPGLVTVTITKNGSASAIASVLCAPYEVVPVEPGDVTVY